MRIEEVRRGLAARLRSRQGEIEQAALTRVHAIADPAEAKAPEYTESLPATVEAAIEYGIAAVGAGEERPPSMPTALLSQARLAARNGIPLEVVLRRYLAGYTLLGDFLIEESAKSGQLNGTSLKRLLRIQASLFDQLIATVSEEYGREVPVAMGSTEHRISERVGRLLEGQLIDTSDIAYDFEGYHLGLVGAGAGAAAAIHELAAALDRCLLLVSRGEGTLWAWLGGRNRPDRDKLQSLLEGWPSRASLAWGEPGKGLAGWRLSHRQAQAALPIALRGSERVVGYVDVALLASMLRDDLLSVSLRELYLAPLEGERDQGAVARQTLRAYFTAERNVTSTAAALGVNRQTVTNRLRAIEERLGRSLGTCLTEIDAALRLEGLREGDFLGRVGDLGRQR